MSRKLLRRKFEEKYTSGSRIFYKFCYLLYSIFPDVNTQQSVSYDNLNSTTNFHR